MAQPITTVTRTASGQDVADAFDVHPHTVHEWAKVGCPHTKGRGRAGATYDLPEVAAWMKANGVTGKPGRPAGTVSADLEAAKLRKENALASKYELQVAREKRDLVPLDEVRTTFFEEVGRAKSRLSGLPADVAAQLEGLDAAEIQAVLQGRVEQILTDLATGLR